MDHLSTCPAWAYEKAEGKPEAERQAAGELADDLATLAMRDEHGAPIVIPASVAREHDQMYRAWEMKQRGKTWDVIASVIGYPTEQAPSGTAMAAAVRRYLEDGQRVIGDFKRKEFMALLLARYEAATDAVWDEAMRGKPASVMAFLATQDRIQKLVGMEDGDKDAAATSVTVIVRPSDFVQDLQAIAPPIEDVEEEDEDIADGEIVDEPPDTTP